VLAAVSLILLSSQVVRSRGMEIHFIVEYQSVADKEEHWFGSA
jgi:hypothetical protein